MSDNSDQNFNFRIVLFLYIVLMLFLFTRETTTTGIKMALVAFLFVALYMDYMMDTSASAEGFDSDDELTNRQRKIKELNLGRSSEGRFLVNCGRCGRDRIIDDRFNNLRLRYMRSRDSCVSPCKDTEEKSMSFFNENYVDSSKVFCYNCLIDSEEKNRAYEQDYGGVYVYWPSLDDPVNGPPYV